jgi:hypothetical protein
VEVWQVILFGAIGGAVPDLTRIAKAGAVTQAVVVSLAGNGHPSEGLEITRGERPDRRPRSWRGRARQRATTGRRLAIEPGAR